jgi:hypothetical protein
MERHTHDLVYFLFLYNPVVTNSYNRSLFFAPKLWEPHPARQPSRRNTRTRAHGREGSDDLSLP